MAIYFLYMKNIGRSNGSSAVGAIAYRAGERIRDERTGRTHDHSHRRDVLHKEIILPGEFRAADLPWARDRAALWNGAEAAETRRNARVAREYLVALPSELSPEQRIGLARQFSYDLADRYRFAVDFAIHAPRDDPRSDPRNFHAHILTTTREVTPEGLGSKTTLDWSDRTRLERGLRPVVHEVLFARERWAAVTNEALRAAHVEARVDHRSLRDQGVDREPRPRIPQGAWETERRGGYSEIAERMRLDYEARERQRMDRSAALAAAPPPSAKPPSLEEIRRQARESWLRMRQEAATGTAAATERTPAQDQSPDHSR